MSKLAPQSVLSTCTHGPCGLKLLGTWQNKSPRVLSLVARFVLGWYKLEELAAMALVEFQQPEFEGYGPKPSKSVSEDTSNEVSESPEASLIKELVSDDKLEKKTVFPTIAKIEFVRPKQQEKPVRKPVKYAEMYRSQSPRGNQRNWKNNQKSQQLGSDFVMVNYNYAAQKAHPSTQRNMAPRAVLTKTGLRPLNTARPVNIAHPKTTVYSARPMPKAVNTARPNTTIVNAIKANQATYPISQTSKPLMDDMLHLGDEPKEEELLVKELLKLVLLKVLRKNNMYSVDMKNIVPKKSLTCLVAKATLDESMLWHKRLGHCPLVGPPGGKLLRMSKLLAMKHIFNLFCSGRPYLDNKLYSRMVDLEDGSEA
ncbi:hypothetical protein Tco_1475491 [Tanacetum coccineum]